VLKSYQFEISASLWTLQRSIGCLHWRNKDDELHDVRSQVEHGFDGNMQVYGLGSLS